MRAGGGVSSGRAGGPCPPAVLPAPELLSQVRVGCVVQRRKRHVGEQRGRQTALTVTFSSPSSVASYDLMTAHDYPGSTATVAKPPRPLEPTRPSGASRGSGRSHAPRSAA